jgi:hypothetical protein
MKFVARENSFSMMPDFETSHHLDVRAVQAVIVNVLTFTIGADTKKD